MRAANPRFVFNDTYGAASITPRDLLSHRTGLPRHDRVTFGAATRDEMMQAVAFLPLDKPVRYAHEYNNMMLVAAGVAAESATATQWEDLVTRRIFHPLGMNDTCANLSTAMRTARPQSLAVPYIHSPTSGAYVKMDRTNADVGAPCGGILSSVRDMLKWQQMHLTQAKAACDNLPNVHPPAVHCHAGTPPAAAGPTLLRDETWLQLLASNTIYPLLTSFGGYSLGLWVEPWIGEEMLLHHVRDAHPTTCSVCIRRPCAPHLCVCACDVGMRVSRRATSPAWRQCS